jgi:hypothetical protein
MLGSSLMSVTGHDGQCTTLSLKQKNVQHVVIRLPPCQRCWPVLLPSFDSSSAALRVCRRLGFVKALHERDGGAVGVAHRLRGLDC